MVTWVYLSEFIQHMLKIYAFTICKTYLAPSPPSKNKTNKQNTKAQIRTRVLLMKKGSLAQVLGVHTQENDSWKIPNEPCPGDMELGVCEDSG